MGHDGKPLPPGAQGELLPLSQKGWLKGLADDERRRYTLPFRVFRGVAHGAGEAITNLASAPSGFARLVGKGLQSVGAERAGKAVDRFGETIRPTSAEATLDKEAPKTWEGKGASFAGQAAMSAPIAGGIGLRGMAVQNAGMKANESLDAGATSGQALMASTLTAAKDMAIGNLFDRAIPPATRGRIAEASTKLLKSIGRGTAMGTYGDIIDKATWDPNRPIAKNARTALANGLALELVGMPSGMRASSYRKAASEHPGGTRGFVEDMKRTATKSSVEALSPASSPEQRSASAKVAAEANFAAESAIVPDTQKRRTVRIGGQAEGRQAPVAVAPHERIALSSSPIVAAGRPTTPTIPLDPHGRISLASSPPMTTAVKPGNGPAEPHESMKIELDMDHAPSPRRSASVEHGVTRSVMPQANRSMRIDFPQREHGEKMDVWIGRQIGLLFENEQAAMARYRSMPATKDGKIVSPDLIGEMVPGIKANPTIGHAVHDDRLGVMTWRAWDDRLAPQGDRSQKCLILMGSPASGKTTFVNKAEASSYAILDAPLTDLHSARSVINQVKDGGRTAEVPFVHRPFLDTVRSMVDRAMDEGRTVSLDGMAKLHHDGFDTFTTLGREYRGVSHVNFSLTENGAGPKGEPVIHKGVDAIARARDLKPAESTGELHDLAGAEYLSHVRTRMANGKRVDPDVVRQINQSLPSTMEREGEQLLADVIAYGK
jgi:hypothetical protein